jgi:hypothetical protein
VTRVAAFLPLLVSLGSLAACGDDGAGSVIEALCAHEATCEPDDSNVRECEAAVEALLASLDQVFGPSCTNPTMALLRCQATAPCNDTSTCDGLEQTANDACPTNRP